MTNFTPLTFKKNNKGKFFVFGNLFLLLMIAGIGIFYYNKTLITTQQKAVAPGACQCANSAGHNVGGCECNGSNAFCPAGTHVKNNRCGESSGNGNPDQQNNSQSCGNSGGIWCDVTDVNGNSHSFCINSNGSEGGCNAGAVARGYTMQTGGTGNGTGGWRCVVGQHGYNGGQCVEYNSVETVGCHVPSCFCGTLQIDSGCGSIAGTYQSTCGCGNNNQSNNTTTTNTGTTPTEIPTTALTPTEAALTPTEAISPTEGVTPSVTPTNGPSATPTPTKPGSTSTPTPITSLPQSGKLSPFVFAIPIGIIIGGLVL